jgi:hypothetical protein
MRIVTIKIAELGTRVGAALMVLCEVTSFICVSVCRRVAVLSSFHS